VVQRWPTLARCPLLELSAQPGIGRWEVRQSVKERREVKHGATHQQRGTTPTETLSYKFVRLLTELCSRERLIEPADIDKAMGKFFKQIRAGFGGANIEFSIDLPRINTD
jgi:hypothetical protein